MDPPFHGFPFQAHPSVPLVLAFPVSQTDVPETDDPQTDVAETEYAWVDRNGCVSECLYNAALVRRLLTVEKDV